MSKKPTIEPGGMEKYIAGCPKVAHSQLKEMRKLIRSVAPNAVETVSYFDMPGYAYAGYGYNGMFAWFSYKSSFVRLHVRPQALLEFKKEAGGYTKTKAVICFPLESALPKTLIKQLVRASIRDMKNPAKNKQ